MPAVTFTKSSVVVDDLSQFLLMLEAGLIVPVCKLNTFTRKEGVFVYNLTCYSGNDSQEMKVIVNLPHELTMAIEKRSGKYGDFGTVPLNDDFAQFRDQLKSVESWWLDDIVEKNKTEVTEPLIAPESNSITLSTNFFKEDSLDVFLESLKVGGADNKGVYAQLVLGSGKISKTTSVVGLTWMLSKILKGVPKEAGPLTPYTGRRAKRPRTEISSSSEAAPEPEAVA